MGFSSSELFQNDSQLGSIDSVCVSKMERDQRGGGGGLEGETDGSNEYKNGTGAGEMAWQVRMYTVYCSCRVCFQHTSGVALNPL